MISETKKIVIADGNSIIHRAYHALPKLTTKDGKLVNAVYGFFLVFFKVIEEFKPDFFAVAFDLPAPTFRHNKYKEYKAKRQKAPQELYDQIPLVKNILKELGVAVFEKAGFEADDIIGTIDKKAKEEYPGISVIIASGDSDSFQLIDENTKVYILRKGVKDIVLCDEKTIQEKFSGLKPKQLIDYKALRGDPSDNIPGIKGVGDKTAMDLLLRFDSLENIYKEIKENSENSKNLKEKLRKNLIASEQNAFFSKELVVLEKESPIEFNLGKCAWGDYDKEKIIKLFESLEFYTLAKRLSVSAKLKEGDKPSSQGKLL
jgi:DNA polymerase I